MIYQWSELDSVFEKLDLEIFDIDLSIHPDKEYTYNNSKRIGAIGKTTWYFQLSDKETAELGLEGDLNCGLKIIKYPVFSDVMDEYYRLLSEYSIQKILNKNDMAPDIYKLILVRSKNHLEIEYDWLPSKIVFPNGSIFFAQLVEHIDNSGFENRIPVTSEGIPFGNEIESFVSKCDRLRILPYDINDENVFLHEGKIKVVDVHKWRRNYSVLVPSAPKYVQIELNNSCNARCRMCNIPQMTRCKGLMSDELFIKILKEANKNGVEFITPFLHGEPFLRPDFIEKLKLINLYAPKAKITVFTNASMLTEKILHELNSIYNIEQLVFSFPGGNKEIYEKVTGLDFEKSRRNIIKAFEILEDIPMRISMPMYEENVESEKDFYTLWNGYPCSAYKTYNYLDDVKGTLSETCYEQCDRAFRSMTVMFDGRVCLCCMDSDGKYIMGDISEQSMLEIWNGEEFVKLRRLHSICRNAYEPCSTCTLDLKTEEYSNAFINHSL